MPRNIFLVIGHPKEKEVNRTDVPSNTDTHIYVLHCNPAVMKFF